MTPWDTLIEESADAVFACLREVVTNGRDIPPDAPMTSGGLDEETGQGFVVYEYPPTPLAYAAVCQTVPGERSLSLVTGYPYPREGSANVYEVMTLLPGEGGATGRVECVSRSRDVLTFFDPLFCLHKDVLKVGAKYEFSVAALAYHVEWVEKTEIEIGSGPALEMERQRVLSENPDADVSTITSVKFSMAEMRSLMGCDAHGNAEFHTAVGSVEWFSLMEARVCRIQCVIRDGGGEEWPLTIYAGERVLKGYRPEPGQVVRGSLWLQAMPMREVPSEESWMDTGSESEGDWDGIMRAMAAQDYLADLHPAVSGLGFVLVGAGWDVTKYEKDRTEIDVPDIRVERKERAINIWVDARMEGEAPGPVLSENDKAELSDHSRERGEEAIFTTVVCRIVGDYYHYDFPDKQKLEDVFGNISLVEALRIPGTGPSLP